MISSVSISLALGQSLCKASSYNIPFAEENQNVMSEKSVESVAMYSISVGSMANDASWRLSRQASLLLT